MRVELSEILEAELDDPRAPSVHVTKVELSKDLANAKVFLSPSEPGAIEDEKTYLEPIVRASGYIRSQLAERLDLRRTPLLDFRLDRGQMNADRIETLLDRVKKRSKGGLDELTALLIAALLCTGAARAAVTSRRRAQSAGSPATARRRVVSARAYRRRAVAVSRRADVLARSLLAPRPGTRSRREAAPDPGSRPLWRRCVVGQGHQRGRDGVTDPPTGLRRAQGGAAPLRCGTRTSSPQRRGSTRTKGASAGLRSSRQRCSGAHAHGRDKEGVSTGGRRRDEPDPKTAQSPDASGDGAHARGSPRPRCCGGLVAPMSIKSGSRGAAAS